ncbi:hypothetical protein F1D61_16535 [Methylobacterium aquaticum]|nr:hypothetical protein F1D61_16535 [Methylobacterium aquaticum]
MLKVAQAFVSGQVRCPAEKAGPNPVLAVRVVVARGLSSQDHVRSRPRRRAFCFPVRSRGFRSFGPDTKDRRDGEGAVMATKHVVDWTEIVALTSAVQQLHDAVGGPLSADHPMRGPFERRWPRSRNSPSSTLAGIRSGAAAARRSTT